MGKKAIDFWKKSKFRKPPKGVRYGVLTLTPKLATWLLKHCNNVNRRRFIKKKATYILNMSNDDWTRTHVDLIVFQEFADGHIEILDGQNRVAAVEESGRTVVFDIKILPPDLKANLRDTGTGFPQHLDQNFRHDGVEYYKVAADVTKALVRQESGRTVSESTADCTRFYLKHREVIDLVCLLTRDSATGSVKGINTGFRTALVRAMYHIPATRLVLFCKIYKTLVCEKPGDKAATDLRAYYMENLVKHDRGGTGPTDTWTEVCASALLAYKNKEEMPRVGNLPLAKDVLPLPGAGNASKEVRKTKELLQQAFFGGKNKKGQDVQIDPETKQGRVLTALKTSRKLLTCTEVQNLCNGIPYLPLMEGSSARSALSSVLKNYEGLVENTKDRKWRFVK